MERVDHAGITDDELMARLCRRDLAAFGALYDRYSDLVYSVSLRVVADPHVAQDVTQDVFLRVWRRPERFDLQRGKFVTWLLSVARNRSIDERRSQGRGVGGRGRAAQCRRARRPGARDGACG